MSNESSPLLTREANESKDSDTLIDEIRERLKQFYRLRFGLSSISATLYLLIFEYSDVDVFNLFLAPIFAFFSGATSFLRWYWYNLPEYNLSKNKHLNIFLKCIFNAGLAIFSLIGVSVAICLSAAIILTYLNTVVTAALGIVYFAKLMLKLSQTSVWLYRALRAEVETDRSDECWGRTGKYAWSSLYCIGILIGIGFSLFSDTMSSGASKIIFSFALLSVASMNTFYDDIKNTLRQKISWPKITRSKKAEFAFPSFSISETLKNDKLPSDRARLIKCVLFKAFHLNLKELTPNFIMSDDRKISDIDPIEYYSNLYFDSDELIKLKKHIEITYTSSSEPHNKLATHLETIKTEIEENKNLINMKYPNATEWLNNWHLPNPWEGKFSYSDMKVSLKALQSYCKMFNKNFQQEGKALVLLLLDKKIDLLKSKESQESSGYFNWVASCLFSDKQKNGDKKQVLIWLKSCITEPSTTHSLTINKKKYQIKDLKALYSLLDDQNKNDEESKEIYDFFTRVFSSTFESKGEVETLLKFTGCYQKMQSATSSCKSKSEITRAQSLTTLEQQKSPGTNSVLRRRHSEPMPSSYSDTSQQKRSSSFSIVSFFKKPSVGIASNRSSYTSNLTL